MPIRVIQIWKHDSHKQRLLDRVNDHQERLHSLISYLDLVMTKASDQIWYDLLEIGSLTQILLDQNRVDDSEHIDNNAWVVARHKPAEELQK